MFDNEGLGAWPSILGNRVRIHIRLRKALFWGWDRCRRLGYYICLDELQIRCCVDVNNGSENSFRYGCYDGVLDRGLSGQRGRGVIAEKGVPSIFVREDNGDRESGFAKGSGCLTMLPLS